jgi:hypothetical protein
MDISQIKVYDKNMEILLDASAIMAVIVLGGNDADI